MEERENRTYHGCRDDGRERKVRIRVRVFVNEKMVRKTLGSSNNEEEKEEDVVVCVYIARVFVVFGLELWACLVFSVLYFWR